MKSGLEDADFSRVHPWRVEGW